MTGRRLVTVLTVMAAFVGAAPGQISVLSPSDGETVTSRRLTVKVAVDDPKGYVMIWFDGKFLMGISYPFETNLDLAELKALSGDHVIRVVGRNASGQLAGQADIRITVNLTGEGISEEGLILRLKGRVGDFAFYTLKGESAAKGEVPTKAIRETIAGLTTRLTLPWRQIVRDVTADNQFRIVRAVEEGLIQRTLSFRIAPAASQEFGFLTVLPNGTVVTGVDVPSVIQLVSGINDIALPDRPIRVGESWTGRMAIPRNLENLTVIGGGAQQIPGMGMAGPMAGMPGMRGEEEEPMGIAGGRGGVMMPPTAPAGQPVPQADAGTLILADAPIVSVRAIHTLEGFESYRGKSCARIVSTFRAPAILDISQAGAIGAAPGTTGAPGAAGPGMMPGGMPGMMGPGGGGAIGVPPMRGGGAVGGPPARGGFMGPMGGGTAPPAGLTGGVGATPAPALQPLKGNIEGKRILLFDIESGHVVFSRLEVTGVFNTDYLTIIGLAPAAAPAAGPAAAPQAPGQAPGVPAVGPGPMVGPPAMGTLAGGPMRGAMAPGLGPPGPGVIGEEERGGPGGVPGRMAPGIAGPAMGVAQQPSFVNVPAKIRYQMSLENTLDQVSRIDQLMKFAVSSR